MFAAQVKFNSPNVQNLFDAVEKRDPDQAEFLQAVQEVLETMEPVFEKYPQVCFPLLER
jgi:membrane-bound lytic murein transglycosylase MltF